MADDLDYMSDEFLKQLENAAPLETTDPRFASKKKRKALPPPPPKKLNEKMAEAREQGLSQSIPKDNIGHKLLKRMGYKEGEGIGRTTTGRSAPLEVNLKLGKGGLGRDTQIKEKKKKAMDKLIENEKTVQNHFRSNHRSYLSGRKVRSDLYKCKGICEDLDTKAGIPYHYLWPIPEVKAKPAAEEEEEAIKPLTEDEKEERMHKLVRVDDELPGPDPAVTVDMPMPFELVCSELNEVITYLRQKHFYCFYCAIKFEGDEDMTRNCPGPTEKDHDD